MAKTNIRFRLQKVYYKGKVHSLEFQILEQRETATCVTRDYPALSVHIRDSNWQLSTRIVDSYGEPELLNNTIFLRGSTTEANLDISTKYMWHIMPELVDKFINNTLLALQVWSNNLHIGWPDGSIDVDEKQMPLSEDGIYEF